MWWYTSVIPTSVWIVLECFKPAWVLLKTVYDGPGTPTSDPRVDSSLWMPRTGNPPIDIAVHLAISQGSARHIIHDTVPQSVCKVMTGQLTPKLKRRNDACEELFLRFEAEGGGYCLELLLEENLFLTQWWLRRKMMLLYFTFSDVIHPTKVLYLYLKHPSIYKQGEYLSKWDVVSDTLNKTMQRNSL